MLCRLIWRPIWGKEIDDEERIILGRYFFAQGAVKCTHTALPSPSLIPDAPQLLGEDLPMAPEEQLLDLALQIALEHTFVDEIYLTKIIIMLFFLYSTSVLHYDTIPTTQVQVTGQSWLPWRELCFPGLHYSLEPMWPCCPGGAHRLNKTPWDLAPRVGNRFAVNLGKSNWDLLVGELFFSESFLREFEVPSKWNDSVYE